MGQIIYRNGGVTIFQSALYQTNSVLVERPEMVLISDPCWLPEEVAMIREFTKAVAADKPQYLFLTHSDYDHIIAVGAFPAAEVIASQALAEREDQEAELEVIRKFDDGRYIRRDYPIVYPTVDQIVSENGASLTLGGSKWRAWLSPGHHRDGMCLLEEESGLFLVGDYLSDVEFPFVYDSFEAYRETLNQLEEVIRQGKVRMLVPGHGRPTGDAEEMSKRIVESREYLQDIELAKGDGEAFPLKKWLSRYPFPRGLQTEHEKNMSRWRELHAES